MSDFPVNSTTNIVIVLGNNSIGCQKDISTEKPEDFVIQKEKNWIYTYIYILIALNTLI